MPDRPQRPLEDEPAQPRGLDVSREFFFEWGLPLLEAEYPQLAPRIAAGRIVGSDVLGGDDEISRDHHWGPHFDLFLSAADHAAFAAPLAKAMNAAAPNPWRGHRLIGDPPEGAHVHCIPSWIATWTGVSRPSRRARDWRHANESQLYFLRHGAVFLDRSGELSHWREVQHAYPEAILRKRLAEELFRVWHHGEYNFVQRMTRRRDPVAIAICLGEFVSGVMRLVLLMDRDFTPYWKWLAFEFRKRPAAAEYAPLLERLVRTTDIDAQAALVTDISALVHRRLVADGWVTGRGGRRSLPLLNDHNELIAQGARRKRVRPSPAPGEGG